MKAFIKVSIGKYQSEGWEKLNDLFVNFWEWKGGRIFLFWEWNKTKIWLTLKPSRIVLLPSSDWKRQTPGHCLRGRARTEEFNILQFWKSSFQWQSTYTKNTRLSKIGFSRSKVAPIIWHTRLVSALGRLAGLWAQGKPALENKF